MEITTFIKKKKDFIDIQRELYKNGELMNQEVTDTKSELVIGQKLIDNHIYVIPQFKVGDYPFDLKIKEYPILIEVDGSIHNEYERRVKDYRKDRYAQKRGFLVLRFTNEEGLTPLNIVEEVKSFIRNSGKSPKEIWLYTYTIIDKFKDFYCILLNLY